MTIIRWEMPTERKRASGRLDWSPTSKELRENPGRWAVVYETDGGDVEAERAKSVAQGIRSANLTAFKPRGAFEAAYRRVDNKSVVYARFRSPETEQ